MGLLLVALLAFGNWRAVVYLPIALLLTLIMAMFALGFGLLLSVLNVYFRDIQHFMGILFLAWVYLTPIIYPITYVPARFQTLLKLNPMTDASLSYRAALYDGRPPGLVAVRLLHGLGDRDVRRRPGRVQPAGGRVWRRSCDRTPAGRGGRSASPRSSACSRSATTRSRAPSCAADGSSPRTSGPSETCRSRSTRVRPSA